MVVTDDDALGSAVQAATLARYDLAHLGSPPGARLELRRGDHRLQLSLLMKSVRRSEGCSWRNWDGNNARRSALSARYRELLAELCPALGLPLKDTGEFQRIIHAGAAGRVAPSGLRFMERLKRAGHSKPHPLPAGAHLQRVSANGNRRVQPANHRRGGGARSDFAALSHNDRGPGSVGDAGCGQGAGVLNAPGSMEMAFSQPTMSLINLLAYPWEGTLAEKTSPLAPEDWRALLEEAEKRALTLTLYYRLRVGMARRLFPNGVGNLQDRLPGGHRPQYVMLHHPRDP